MRRIFAVLLSLLLLVSLVALTSGSVQQKSDRSSALASLVAAERAFAHTSVEKGIRDSFLEFFSDDAINFQPHPVKAREAILSRPAPPVRPPVTLNWEPVWADVSAAGDLGYTTGPYTLTDNSPERRPTRHGYYFSVWKKQPSGDWKVALDLGIQVPSPPAQMPAFHAVKAVQVRAPGFASLEAGRAAVKELERELQQRAQARGLSKAMLDYLTDESRLHRQGMLPMIGRDAIRAFLSQKSLSASWEPMGADIARSGDLAYVYGSYELKDNPRAGATIEKGYYARVWKRMADGKWKLALETTSPLSPEQK